MTAAFELLHPAVQRKLWDMKWTELRPIQVAAIEHLLGGTPTDCIISSPTASGKTEAAFLPVLSAIADEPYGSVRAMYIGPLKALIDDQFGRVEELCARMEMPVHRWHGDVDDAPRKALLAKPSGVLLITPESLEAMFVLRAAQLPSLFGGLAHVVIDETHAFLGTERGAQLISQLHRLRLRTGADPMRIGLSATLGDPDLACRWLRRDGRPVRLIDVPAATSEIRMRVRGVWRQPPPECAGDEQPDDPAVREVARGIMLACRGKTNLVFANAKSSIEELADELAAQARELSIADEIVVHHGSLSKEQRRHAEERLRSELPCTAVCSNTLELGIDIGAIDEVVQVSPPPSVAALVQRLGRSGRRPGSARVLRGYFIEDVDGPQHDIWDRMHLRFVRGVASIELLLAGWIEPPRDRANLSTAVQQILSILAETGGIRAQELFARLSGSGAFPTLARGDLVMLLRELGARELIEQLPDASLVVGIRGQRIVEHYSFYAAFKAPAEFEVRHRDRSIGTLPESMLPGVGEHLILAGRRWLVDDIDLDRRQVYVLPSRGKRPPRFGSEGGDVAPEVHARMRAVLLGDNVPSYLDEAAIEILVHARRAAADAAIDRLVHVDGEHSVLSLWPGSRIERTLFLALASAGVEADASGGVALSIGAAPRHWVPVLRRLVETRDATGLAAYADERLGARVAGGDKFDLFLPASLWRAAYVREQLDVDGAVRVARRVIADVDRPVGARPPPREGAAMVSIPSLTRWAEEVVALEAGGPLPARVVLVPSEAHAHALRVHLSAVAPHALAGTRFVTSSAAARAVLDAAGIDYTTDEEQRRPWRLRRLLREQRDLSTYCNDRLRSAGWERAFASSIEQLEWAGVRPEQLDQVDDARARDLASIWRAADVDAARSWTTPRVLAEARALLARGHEAWPFSGRTLASVDLGISAIEAAFVRVIPRLTIGGVGGRPARRAAIDRVRAVIGEDAAAAMAFAGSQVEAGDELELLQQLLFEDPARLAGDRQRSTGADGTVSLEVYAGVNEEIDATCRWLAEEIFDHRTRLQDIALLVPRPDPWGSLLADRISAMPWPARVSPTYLACGRPAVTTASGVRLHGLLTALRDFLPADAVTELAPRLRLAGRDDHLSPGRARELIWNLGVLGGSLARPADAMRWIERLAREDLDEDTRSLAPALRELVAVAGHVLAGAAISTLWSSVRSFVRTHLRAQATMDDLLEQLSGQIDHLERDPAMRDVAGAGVIELSLELLGALRLREGRFGEPRIYIGPIDGAAGLPFRAVRIIGLAEGSFPGTLREDPILPAELRRMLPAGAMPSGDDHAAIRLHAFDRCVRGATSRLALSASRTDLDGSERAPAALFTEVAAALGRPDAATGAPARLFPTGTELERDAFSVARAARATRLAAKPLLESCWLDVVARDPRLLPSMWEVAAVIDPRAVTEAAGRMSGELGAVAPRVTVFGTDPLRPLSASALRTLLTCPQQFFLERMVGFRPAKPHRESHRIEPAAYGALVHEIAEALARQHGLAFGERRETRDHWFAVADTLACERFDAFLDKHPLHGQAIVDAERHRLRRDIRLWIEEDWYEGRPRSFVATEVEFGDPREGQPPVAISTPQGPLFVTGRIDRVDIEDGRTLVRDLKTGRAYPRDRDLHRPDSELDIQLALYTQVVRDVVGTTLPPDVAAAYVYLDPSAPVRERAFRSDVAALQIAGERWFALASALVRENLYVRTPNASECSRCAFSAVCGDQATATADQLRDAVGTLARFRELKE